jgi:hypothetical protein
MYRASLSGLHHLIHQLLPAEVLIIFKVSGIFEQLLINYIILFNLTISFVFLIFLYLLEVCRLRKGVKWFVNSRGEILC